MSNDGLLDRAGLERAFAALGDRLVRRGVVADLFIVGGAAMALAYDAQRVTRDVDATFVPHGVVLEEARNVAAALGLPPWWLNEQASAYVSAQHDVGKREVFDHPGIRVMAASPEHVFAMKAFAARTRDEEDLRILADLIGITTTAAALELCAHLRASTRRRWLAADPGRPRLPAAWRECARRCLGSVARQPSLPCSGPSQLHEPC